MNIEVATFDFALGLFDGVGDHTMLQATIEDS